MEDKNEKIHQALSFLDKAKTANNDVEKEENLLAYVNAMILVYEEGDADNETTIKRLISACKQVVKFYDEKEQPGKSLPYNRRINDLCRRMYEKDIQSLDWSVKYSTSILTAAENYFDTENKEDADAYFSSGNKLLARLKKNYPEDEAVKKVLRIRRRVKKKLYASEEEESQEDAAPEIAVTEEIALPEIQETVDQTVETEKIPTPEISSEIENMVMEETPDQQESTQEEVEISTPDEQQESTQEEVEVSTPEPIENQETSTVIEEPVVPENYDEPEDILDPIPVPEENSAEKSINQDEPVTPDQPEPESLPESPVAEEPMIPESPEVPQNPIPEAPPVKEKPTPPVKKQKNQSAGKILIILAFLLIVVAFGLVLYYFINQTSDSGEAVEKDTIEIAETVAAPENNDEANLSEEIVQEEETEPVEMIVKEEAAEPVNISAPQEEPRTEKPESPAKQTPKEVLKEPVPKVEKPEKTEKIEEPAPKPVPVVSDEPRYVTQRFNNGNQYSGYVNASGKKQGKGTYVWANGDKYVGDFMNDQATGQGIYYSHEGWRYEGGFRDLKFHGKGTYYFSNGKKKDGVWENGIMK